MSGSCSYIRPLLKSDTAIQRYSDTAIQRYSDTAIHGAGATHKLCKFLLLITAGDISNNIFGGGAQIPKNISYKFKMRKVI